ncbi:hypothetical protein O6H91_09G023300 [Diphasiastrum complanatum]|nr:hypothetical protein O6H91_09G023300 [Diphasiastrum complanatum]
MKWGPQLEQGPYKNLQRLYISEQTIEKYPNTLVVANCEVVKPRIAAAEHICQFNEEAKSPFVKKHKTIIHPGEVNRIREMPQNSKIVATHTDSAEVLIWNVETQPNRTAHVGAVYSRPDLILTGHADNAEYALALSATAPFVLSGGKDKQVLLWSIEDHVPDFREPAPLRQDILGGKLKLGGFQVPTSDPTTIGPRGHFRGHTMTVEDVQFRPFSTQEFCSVGDDACLILWDARIGSEAAIKVESAHDSDVHCVDWNAHDDNYILTGSADTSVRLFDHRKLSASGHGLPVEKFEGHTAAVLCVQWCPDGRSVFGSSAEDGILNVWDFEKVNRTKQEGKVIKKRAQYAPPGLFFQHAGHR